MTEPLPDTWHSRDLIVLRAAVAAIDETRDMAETSDLAARTGLSFDDVERAALALHRAGLVDAKPFRSAGGISTFGIADVSGTAYTLAGAWPSADAGADRMIAALESLAEHGTPEDRTRAQRVLESLRGAGRQVAVSVAAAVISGHVT